MYLPLLFSIAILWFSVFNPQLIDAIPLDSLWMKQLVYGIIVCALWCCLALAGLKGDREY